MKQLVVVMVAFGDTAELLSCAFGGRQRWIA